MRSRIHTPKRKTDTNQGAVVQALEGAGCTVQSLAAAGKGVPDLLVGYRGINLLMEVKNPLTKGKLTADQTAWHAQWRGSVRVVYTPIEALLWVMAEAVRLGVSPQREQPFDASDHERPARARKAGL